MSETTFINQGQGEQPQAQADPFAPAQGNVDQQNPPAAPSAPDPFAGQREEPVAEAPASEEPATPAPEPEKYPAPDKPVRIKRRFKSRDLKTVAKILGRIQNMAEDESQKRERQLTQQEIMGLVFSKGLDYAERDVYLWVADMCEIKLTANDIHEGASAQERENALVDKIADQDIEFLGEVFEDLVLFGGLEGFLTRATRAWNTLGLGRQLSSG